MNVTVIGPVAAPPASKAIAANSGVANRVSNNAIIYPGTTKYQRDIPVITRLSHEF
jgi:hypothetical protein